MSNIIEHLRYHGSQRDGMDPIALLMHEAADELELLHREVERLHQELDRTRGKLEGLYAKLEHLLVAIAAMIVIAILATAATEADAAKGECLPSLHAARKAHPTEHLTWARGCYRAGFPGHHSKTHKAPRSTPRTAPVPPSRDNLAAAHPVPPVTVPVAIATEPIRPLAVRIVNIKPLVPARINPPTPLLPPASIPDRNALADALDRRAAAMRRIIELEAEIDALKAGIAGQDPR